MEITVLITLPENVIILLEATDSIVTKAFSVDNGVDDKSTIPVTIVAEMVASVSDGSIETASETT